MRILRIALATFAGPHRIQFHRLGSFGGVAQGVTTWIGILVVYLALVEYVPSTPPAMYPYAAVYWLALILLGWVHMFAGWIAPREEGRNHSWLGAYEATVVCVLALLAALGSPGWCLYLVLGYACSEADLALVAARSRGEDLSRLGESARGAYSGLKGSARARYAAGSAAAMRLARVAAPVSSRVLERVWRVFREPAAPAAGPDGQAALPPPTPARRTTFWGRVGSHIIAHFILGTIGLGTIYMVLVYVFVGVGIFLGLKVEVPEHLKVWPPPFIARMRDSFGGAKEEVKERIEDARGRLRGRFSRRHRDEDAWAGPGGDAAGGDPMPPDRAAEEWSRRAAEGGRAALGEARGRIREEVDRQVQKEIRRRLGF